MPRRLPPLNAVRAFEAAARHVSLSKAAAELNVTHSAISRQVKMLEARLGVTLLERSGRGLELTDEGRQYLNATRDIFDRLDTATAELTRRRGREPLVVNASQSFAIRWLMPRLPDFRARCPDIEVRLVTDMEISDFHASDCDLGIHCYQLPHIDRMIRNGSLGGRLKFEKFLEEDMFPLVSPRLLRDGPPLRKPADLRQHTLLHSRSGMSAWGEWLDHAGVSGVNSTAGLQFDHFHFALQAATQGMGVSLGTQPCAGDDIAAGTLVVPFPGLAVRHSHFYLVYSEAMARTPRLIQFREWFLDTMNAEVAKWPEFLRPKTGGPIGSAPIHLPQMKPIKKPPIKPEAAETPRGKAGRRRISARAGA